jgi:amidase
MVPLAHGKDGGGSVRIPAACCGLVGLKVQRGRVSSGPEQGENFLTHSSVLTRTVAETAEVLDVLAGYEPGDTNWAPPPPEPFAQAAGRDPRRLRIGVSTAPPIPADLHPEALRAVRETAELLTQLGHQVEEVEPPWVGRDLLPLFARIFCTNIAVGAFFAGQVTGREPSPELMEPLSWEIWRGVNEYAPLDYPLAKLELEGLTRETAAWWGDLDALLTPALAERPVRIGEIDACSDDPWADFGRSGEFTPFTAMFNVTGQPAISLPLFHGDDGLPLGVQFAGRPADEATLLSLGAQLEAARPWADRRPELAAA